MPMRPPRQPRPPEHFLVSIPPAGGAQHAWYTKVRSIALARLDSDQVERFARSVRDDAERYFAAQLQVAAVIGERGYLTDHGDVQLDFETTVRRWPTRERSQFWWGVGLHGAEIDPARFDTFISEITEAVNTAPSWTVEQLADCEPFRLAENARRLVTGEYLAGGAEQLHLSRESRTHIIIDRPGRHTHDVLRERIEQVRSATAVLADRLIPCESAGTYVSVNVHADADPAADVLLTVKVQPAVQFSVLNNDPDVVWGAPDDQQATVTWQGPAGQLSELEITLPKFETPVLAERSAVTSDRQKPETIEKLLLANLGPDARVQLSPSAQRLLRG